MPKRILSSLICIMIGLNGCASIGPKQIHIDREAYNDIVRETDYEQILKNIVRLRYAEPTSYLKVTSVTASYQFTRGINATAAGAISGSASNEASLGITPSTSYSDAPTISYVPIDNIAFVTALQQPVNFHDVALLVNGGFSNNELIMRLVFDWVGELDNASSATNTKVLDIPNYQQYYTFMYTLTDMIKKRQAYIDPVELNHKAGIIVDFVNNSYNLPEAIQLKQMLGVNADSQDIIMTNQNIYNLKLNKNHAFREENSNEIANNLVFVQMRSINAMLAFLSHSVQIPEADKTAGYVPELKDNSGVEYNWTPLMKGLMNIQSSEVEPTNIFVKTYVNGHWFYISKSDIDSKTTFSFIVRLMNMKAGLGQAEAQTSPVITVPVGPR